MTVTTNPTIDELNELAAKVNNASPKTAVSTAPAAASSPLAKVNANQAARTIKRLEEKVSQLEDVLRHILRDPEQAADMATVALSDQVYKPLPVVWPAGFTLRDLRQKHLVSLFENYDLQTEESSGWKYNGEVAKAAIKAGWFEEPVGPEFVDDMKPSATRALTRAIIRTNANMAADPN